MPHVDEGTLHALLDGALRAMEPERADEVEAHLFACADCRALAAEAATLRGRAGEILGVLEPDAAPDYDDVVARAGVPDATPGAAGIPDARTAARRRSARRVRGLAWAATIVIALGTGYLIRDRLVPERALMFESGADRTEQAESAPPREEAGREAGSASGASGSAADAIPEPAGQVAADPVASTRRREEAAPPAPPPAAPQNAASRVAAPPPAPVLELATQASVEAPPARAIEPEEAGRVTLEEAATILGAPVLVLPDAEVVLLAVAVEGADVHVTSTQRLATGTEIVVTQSRADAPLGTPAEAAVGSVAVAGRAAEARARDADRLAAAPQAPPLLAAPAPAMAAAALAEAPAIVTVRVVVAGAELVLAGPLPEETLRLLAFSARPAP